MWDDGNNTPDSIHSGLLPGESHSVVHQVSIILLQHGELADL